MGAALLVVPALAAAWLWFAPRGRMAALRQLLAGGAAMVVVGGAWPLLMALTPASSRPWISGTSDNSILSLILDYNGLGRLDGQLGGPQAFGGGPGGGGAGAGATFGGASGPLRLLNEALGGQAGWLLGFAVVALIALAVVTRLRRSDPRTGWLIATGGTFLITAGAFSEAKGIFHPYYVAQLAPFTAALIGAGTAVFLTSRRSAGILAAAAVVAGVVTELVVLHDNPGQLSWLPTLLIGFGGLLALALSPCAHPRCARGRGRRAGAAAAGARELGGADARPRDERHLPRGRPGLGGRGLRRPGRRHAPLRRPALERHTGQRLGAGRRLRPGRHRPGGGSFGPAARPPAASAPAAPPRAAAPRLAARPPAAAGPGGFGGGGPFGGDSAGLNAALSYVRQHGGGTIAVSSQQGASASIIQSDADVAGIGGFSGRESEVNATWLAEMVRSGRIRWVLASGSAGFGGNDGRVGSSKVMAAVEQVGTKVTVSTSSGSTTLYDLSGKADALAALAQ